MKYMEMKAKLPRNSLLLTLPPFVDDMDLIRVGDRIQRLHLRYQYEHPVLLLKKHPLTVLVIQFSHDHQLLADIGQTFVDKHNDKKKEVPSQRSCENGLFVLRKSHNVLKERQAETCAFDSIARPHCNGPLPRAGSSASSTRLLARPSLFGDGPVLTGVFPFLSVSRFPDGIATIKQQTTTIHFIRLSETRTDDDISTNTYAHFLATSNRFRQQPLPYSASDLHFSSSSFSAGEISLTRSMSAATSYERRNNNSQDIHLPIYFHVYKRNTFWNNI
ncbi:hypothetical protein T08_13720 [Trichinella sp. T8]|nr:hypothetical protein T08_13720 [Trichinella sp. T8]